MPSQNEIARALGLSKASISVLRHRGMPLDSVAAARRWREEHIKPTMHCANRHRTPDALPPDVPHAPRATAPFDLDRLGDSFDLGAADAFLDSLPEQWDAFARSL